MEGFLPHRLLPGAHLQTIFGQLLRSRLRWSVPTEDAIVEAGDGVRLLLRCSWHPRGGDRPTLLLVHGLEGCDRSVYMVATGKRAHQLGWHVIRMNLRGCGDGLEVCPRLYNAGQTADLVAVVEWLAHRVKRFAIGGFSLGAGLSLLTIARERSRLPDELIALAAVCPPLDMSACADALERRSNTLYALRFVRSLKRSYRSRQRLSPERYQKGRERGVTTLRQFDQVITAFYEGYRDAEDYYRSVSAGPGLVAIERPTLVLASRDDPFIPRESVEKWRISPSVELEVTRAGGHVGFVGAAGSPGCFWAAERMLVFLDSQLSGNRR
ncbi:MAG TPA: alpha/beta fold hydrolase [Vicinamibacteria bacterium]|nr:alpha/beta fold hydrolase [Vicinamibacteria bacterium]